MAYTAPPRDSAAVCSVPNTERLEQMLDEAGFALLVLTAESERTDGVVLARRLLKRRSPVGDQPRRLHRAIREGPAKVRSAAWSKRRRPGDRSVQRSIETEV